MIDIKTWINDISKELIKFYLQLKFFAPAIYLIVYINDKLHIKDINKHPKDKQTYLSNTYYKNNDVNKIIEVNYLIYFLLAYKKNAQHK